VTSALKNVHTSWLRRLLAGMNQKWAWFLLGALFASIFWVIVLIGLNERLLQTFSGFAGQEGSLPLLAPSGHSR
jgi:hypothetical protein